MLFSRNLHGMTSNERIKVLVVDDHSIVREGLKYVLEDSGEFEVVGQAGDGVEAVRVAAELCPDLVVMDVIMPRKDGVEACRDIRDSAPETRVVMLTVASEETAVLEAVAAGATGYLQKETDRERLLSTLRGVFRGELRLPAEAVRGVVAAVRGVTEAGDAADAAGLTAREREILVSFAGGLSYTQIAERRGVKPVTVRNAIYGVQQKLKVTSIQGLVLWTAQNGLLDDYSPDYSPES